MINKKMMLLLPGVVWGAVLGFAGVAQLVSISSISVRAIRRFIKCLLSAAQVSAYNVSIPAERSRYRGITDRKKTLQRNYNPVTVDNFCRNGYNRSSVKTA